MSSKLLKDAIVDAKAVREIALFNAKAYLEEAFQPKLQSMLSAKLKEEIEEEEMQETASSIGTGDNVKAKNGAESSSHDGATKDADKYSAQKVEKWHQEESVKPEEEEGANMEENTITSEEIDEILAQLGQEAEHDENRRGGEDVPVAPQDAAPVPPVDGNVPQADAAPSSPVGSDQPVVPSAPVAPVDGAVPAPTTPPQNDDDVEINIDEIIDSLSESEEKDAKMEEEGKNPFAEKDKKDKGDDDEEDKKVDETYADGKKGGSDSKSASKKEHSTNSFDHGSLTSENKKLKSALNEYSKAFKVLKTQLTEVNLLNAKLLYTNKLFKAHTLNNTQKMKVIEQFDLAKTIREVKLTFNSMNESINLTNVDVPKKSTIAEGLVSKPVASTKPSGDVVKTPINEMASRFQKLAGIKVKK